MQQSDSFIYDCVGVCVRTHVTDAYELRVFSLLFARNAPFAGTNQQNLVVIVAVSI